MDDGSSEECLACHYDYPFIAKDVKNNKHDGHGRVAICFECFGDVCRCGISSRLKDELEIEHGDAWCAMCGQGTCISFRVRLCNKHIGAPDAGSKFFDIDDCPDGNAWQCYTCDWVVYDDPSNDGCMNASTQCTNCDEYGQWIRIKA